MSSRIVVVGAGIAGLTTAALLAQAGHDITVLEAQTYPGGSAGTFFHKGYRFEAGATVAGGFQPNGPHWLVGERLGFEWRVREHEPAWVVHLPDREVALTRDNADVLANFPASDEFWREQRALADLGWSLSAQGLPWPPTDLHEVAQIIKVGLRNFPRDLRILPFALMSTYQWLQWRGLTHNRAFLRFLDAQLLISAQTTTRGAYALYSATALDLARQGVYHVEGGIGGIAEQLVEQVERYGGRVLYKQAVERINVQHGRAVSVTAASKRGANRTEYPADFVIANTTPWNLNTLLGDASPQQLKEEVRERHFGYGAFVLYLGVRDEALPHDLPDHNQFVASYDAPLGEGESLFLSMSPRWDTSRAPVGHRAVTVTTHTQVAPWYAAKAQGEDVYEARKDEYTERMLNGIERYLPGFKAAVALNMPGSPTTYAFYTGRHMGQVGGFPQTSLFGARSPLTGVPNVRLVGDSIFPGQSTAGVSLGALRVADDVIRHLSKAEQRITPAAPPKTVTPPIEDDADEAIEVERLL